MAKATHPTTSVAVTDEDSFPSAEKWAESIRAMLDQQRLHDARREAALAAGAYPEHSWLTQADRILNPTRRVARPARGQGRRLEFTWLRENGDAYHRKWVALLGDQLIACASSFQEVRSAIQGLELDGSPLFHYVD